MIIVIGYERGVANPIDILSRDGGSFGRYRGGLLLVGGGAVDERTHHKDELCLNIKVQSDKETDRLCGQCTPDMSFTTRVVSVLRSLYIMGTATFVYQADLRSSLS
jgi:hypothetical protein